MDVSVASHYRDLLRFHFDRRREANPRYSLRSFARACGISPSTLSLVLRAKMTLSPQRLRDIGRRLKLRREEVVLMALLATRERSPETSLDRIERTIEQMRNRMSTLTLDEGSPGAEALTWEALLIAQFLRERAMTEPSAVEFFGRRFGIEPETTRETLAKLRALGLAVLDGEVRLHGPRQQVLATTKASNTAFRSVHRRFLEIATQALEAQPTPERYSCSEVFSISEESLPALRALTNRFLDELQALASNDSSRNRKVYAATFHSFSLGEPR
jgi:transcriptional regulator with XRE-family HTH domain